MEPFLKLQIIVEKFPDDSNFTDLFSLKVFELPSVVQFLHRNLAYFIFFLFLLILVVVFKDKDFAYSIIRVDNEIPRETISILLEIDDLIDALKIACRKFSKEKTGKKPFTNINLVRI